MQRQCLMLDLALRSGPAAMGTSAAAAPAGGNLRQESLLSWPAAMSLPPPQTPFAGFNLTNAYDLAVPDRLHTIRTGLMGHLLGLDKTTNVFPMLLVAAAGGDHKALERAWAQKMVALFNREVAAAPQLQGAPVPECVGGAGHKIGHGAGRRLPAWGSWLRMHGSAAPRSHVAAGGPGRGLPAAAPPPPPTPTVGPPPLPSPCITRAIHVLAAAQERPISAHPYCCRAPQHLCAGAGGAAERCGRGAGRGGPHLHASG